MPFVSPVTTSGLPAPVAVFPPGDEVTVYEVIAAPPFDAGAVNAHRRLAVARRGRRARRSTRATGAAGTTAFDAAEGALSPTALCAVTVNV